MTLTNIVQKGELSLVGADLKKFPSILIIGNFFLARIMETFSVTIAQDYLARI